MGIAHWDLNGRPQATEIFRKERFHKQIIIITLNGLIDSVGSITNQLVFVLVEPNNTPTSLIQCAFNECVCVFFR